VLKYSYMGMYVDPWQEPRQLRMRFNAVAEPRRRAILSYLARRSAHAVESGFAGVWSSRSGIEALRVLLDVGWSTCARGRPGMLYRTHAGAIRPLQSETENI